MRGETFDAPRPPSTSSRHATSCVSFRHPAINPPLLRRLSIMHGFGLFRVFFLCCYGSCTDPLCLIPHTCKPLSPRPTLLSGKMRECLRSLAKRTTERPVAQPPSRRIAELSSHPVTQLPVTQSPSCRIAQPARHFAAPSLHRSITPSSRRRVSKACIASSLSPSALFLPFSSCRGRDAAPAACG